MDFLYLTAFGVRLWSWVGMVRKEPGVILA